MAIQFYDNKILFKASGTVAMDADCCCDSCVCSTLRSPADCECMPSDYSDWYTFGGWQVGLSWSGSTMPFKFNSGTTLCTPSSCNDLSGTYNIDCPSTITTNRTWCIASFVCTVTDLLGPFTGDYDLYLVSYVQFSTISGNQLDLRMSCTTQAVYVISGTTNPYSSITNITGAPSFGTVLTPDPGGTPGYVKQFDRTYTAINRTHYKYTDCDPAPTCSENTAIGGFRGCASGASTWSTTSTPISGDHNGCNLSGTTATISFRSPIAPPP